jgi:hypothetical protein
LIASTFSVAVLAVPDSMIRLRIYGEVEGRWLLVFVQSASNPLPFLPPVASATSCMKCKASTFLIASPLVLSASR